MVPIGPMPPEGVFEMVRQMGLEPVGPPLRNGPVWVQRAADYYGKPLRVVVDAARAQVVSVEPIGGPPMLHGGPYASTGAPYWRRPYPYGGMMPDDDFAPPGLGDGAARAAAAIGLAAGRPAETRGEIRRHYAGTSAGAAQAAAVRAAGSRRLGRAAASRAAACAGSRAAEARCRVAGCIRRNPRTRCRRSRRWSIAHKQRAPRLSGALRCRR